MNQTYITFYDADGKEKEKCFISSVEFLFDDTENDVALHTREGKTIKLSIGLCSKIGVQ